MKGKRNRLRALAAHRHQPPASSPERQTVKLSPQPSSSSSAAAEASSEKKKSTPRLQRFSDEKYKAYVHQTHDGKMVLRVLDVKVLRPGPSTADCEYEEYGAEDTFNADDHTYAFVHRQKTVDMWNTAIRDHRQHHQLSDVFSSPCDGDLVWDLCEKRGLCCRMALRCKICTYVSRVHTLYDEVPRPVGQRGGRLAAAPNVSVQVALARNSISATAFRDVLLAANCIPPSKSSILRTANKVNPKIIAENKKDMANILEGLKDINSYKGLDSTSPINVEGDCTYNNRLQTARGKTPYQPATQAVYLLAENESRAKKIVAVGTYNKLCGCKHSPTQSHDDTCYANLPQDATIGNEGRYVVDCIKQVTDTGLTIGHITMDGDSNANYTVPTIAQDNGCPAIQVQRCTRHMTRGLENAARAAKFSNTMFGDTKNRGNLQTVQARFSDDLGNRCNAEFNAAFEQYGDDVALLKNKLSYIPDAVITCYQGSHELCVKHSFVCTGDWARPFLPLIDCCDPVITPTEEDCDILRQIINIRLGHRAVDKTYLNNTSNKCEATNRAIAKAVPKNVTFKRNMPGRVHAAVHSVNNLPGKSLLCLSKALNAPLTPGSSVVKELCTGDRQLKKEKDRQKTLQYKTRRAAARNEKFKKHAASKLDKSVVSYKKYMVDVPLNAVTAEHSYATRSKQ